MSKLREAVVILLEAFAILGGLLLFGMALGMVAIGFRMVAG